MAQQRIVDTDGSWRAAIHGLVTHLRRERHRIHAEWVQRIIENGLLSPMTDTEIHRESLMLYDSCLDVLETGSVETLRAYAQGFSERVVPRGVEAYDVLSILPLLRDVLARELFDKYGSEATMLKQVLDAYERVANRIVPTLGASFIEERERIIRGHEEAIRELSTPVLPVRERLLILPIIGMIDPQRAHQLTDQLLRGIRAHRAKVVVMDITGVPTIDASVADHLIRTVEAARLLGATVIVTGLSSAISHTLVSAGVSLGTMRTVGDLQGGIEEAERLLGYKVVMTAHAQPPAPEPEPPSAPE
jgi:rsbT co-antagonist protein RsbR